MKKIKLPKRKSLGKNHWFYNDKIDMTDENIEGWNAYLKEIKKLNAI